MNEPRKPNPEDRKRFAKALGVLGIALGTAARLDAEALQVYGDLLLSEYTIEQLEKACHDFTRELGRKFFPSIPEFHQAVFGNPTEKALEALALVKKAMSGSGSYRCVGFSDPALQVTVERLGGWIELCAEYREIEPGRASYWEHNFRQVYQQALQSGAKPQEPYCRGIAAAQNASFTLRPIPEEEVHLYGHASMKRLPASVFDQKQLAESVNADPRALEG